MTRFDETWCEQFNQTLGQGSALASNAMRILFVVTDTDEGKLAFVVSGDSDGAVVTAGKLPRGEKADITITAKEAVLNALWAGERSRDEAFMAGDLKVEGDYPRWLDHVIATFEAEPWATAWAGA